MNQMLFTQLILHSTTLKIEKPPVLVQLGGEVDLPRAFELLGLTYATRYKDEPWFPALLTELPGFAEVLDEVGYSKMKSSITPDVTFCYYIKPHECPTEGK